MGSDLNLIQQHEVNSGSGFSISQTAQIICLFVVFFSFLFVFSPFYNLMKGNKTAFAIKASTGPLRINNIKLWMLVHNARPDAAFFHRLYK